jgi:hypothetical protein
LTEADFLSKKQLRERIAKYGFIEISDVLHFIDLVCSSPPDLSDYSFIRNKIELCLRHHDDSSNYFIDLREFASELDAMFYGNKGLCK